AGHRRGRQLVAAQAPPEAPRRDQDGREGPGGAGGRARHVGGRARGDRPAGFRLRPPRCDGGWGGSGGWPAGPKRRAQGCVGAVLAISDANTLETTWRSADGKALSGPPAAVKNEHADALKVLKAQIKEIGETLTAQRLRLEQLYLGDREWPLDVWRERYLEEP